MVGAGSIPSYMQRPVGAGLKPAPTRIKAIIIAPSTGCLCIEPVALGTCNREFNHAKQQ